MSYKFSRVTLTLIVLLASCNQASDNGDLESEKKELYSLREDQKELQNRILKLEKEIKKQDPLFEYKPDITTLVSVIEVSSQEFYHKIEVRGSIASRQNIMISAELAGLIQKIMVREGDRVNKGQLLVILDGESIRRSIDELKTQLELAALLYERQARLWEKSVGSEIQYLEAKNRKESLEKRLASANTRLEKTRVKASFSGSIDSIPVNEGEFVMTGMPLVRVVNLNNLYIKADVSERYAGKFKKGDKARVYLPAFEVYLDSRIDAVSDVIHLENRTFTAEVSLKNLRHQVKPNMMVIVELTDYKNENATVIPTNIIQNDDQGQFVFTVRKDGDKQIAEKLHIETGKSYNNMTEVHQGINAGEIVVDRGFRELTNGIAVRIVESES